MELSISFTPEGGHLYEQIYAYIKREIREGKLLENEKLPSTRSLAAYLQVSRSTAQLAYDQLVSEGYLVASKNRGYFVCGIDNLYNLGNMEKRESAGREERKTERQTERNAGRKIERRTEGNAEGKIGRQTERNAERKIERQTEGNAERQIGRQTKQGAESLGNLQYLPQEEYDMQSEAEDTEPVIDFSPRRIDMSYFPYATWKKITKNTLVDARSEMFALGEPCGDHSLRSTIAHYLHLSRGVVCEPEQIVVGAGNDYLLMLLRHILGEGKTIAMEDPTYLRAYRIFRSFGYQVHPVAMDSRGMRADALEKSGAQLAYVMPSHQFPTGTVMPIARRAELLGWAGAAQDRYLIEDDYDSEFRYRGKPVPSLQASDRFGRVIYIGTFSKSIAPAIRISFMILPWELMERYNERCRFFSSTVSRIDQSILDEFIREGYFERYLNKMRNIYRGKHDLILQGLQPFREKFEITGAGAGLHLLLTAKTTGGTGEKQETSCEAFCKEKSYKEQSYKELAYKEQACREQSQKERMERQLTELALQKGVRVYPLSENLIPDMPLPQKTDRGATVMLGYAALRPEEITEGLNRLKEAWL